MPGNDKPPKEGRMFRKILMPSIGFLLLFLLSQAAFPWTEARRLTWTAGDSLNPDVAIEAGINSHNIHLVYSEFSPGNGEIFFRKSTDTGTTWSSPKRLTWTSGTSDYPSISVDMDNHIHVAWHDNTSGEYQIYYKKSTDGGSTWTAMKRLSWTGGLSVNPDLLARPVELSNGSWIVGLHITWASYVDYNDEVFHKSGYDWLGTWTDPVTKRVTWNSGTSRLPRIAVDSESRLHLVWQDSSPGNYEIYYARSVNGGGSWDKERLTWSDGSSEHPTIATDPADNIYVAWDDDKSGNAELYFKNNDAHSPWPLTKRLTWTDGDSGWPCIIAPIIMQPNIVWREYVQADAEIYHKASTDGGNTWPASTRLTWNDGSSYMPVAQIDSTTQNVHVFWADNMSGDFEIYYKTKN